jgi:formate dehydrogenase gamma subunit
MNAGKTCVRAGLGVAAALIVAWAAAAPAAGTDCLECHADRSLAMERGGRTVPLHVDRAALMTSAHRDLACADCHAGFQAESLPHLPKIRPVDCLSCHEGAQREHRFHAALPGATGSNGGPAVSCKGCHGTHEVLPLQGAASTFNPSRLAAACGACHEDEARQYQDSEHGRAFAVGVAGAPGCLACHDRPITAARAGGETVELKITQEKMCLTCHLDDPAIRERMGPQAGFISAYEMSVHGRALLQGKAAAANCVDCHGAHEMKKGFEPTALVNRRHIPETCGACHGDVAKEYAGSVHGQAARKGIEEAPVCTDCHGEHSILARGDPKSRVAPANVSAQVCSPCHASVRLSEKFGLAIDRSRTFADSFHGLALRGGSIAVANCASCHEAHDIRPSSDPESSVHKANLAATCGRCHPGANERFAIGAVHVAEEAASSPVLYWIATAYIILIVVTVGGMFLHNALDYLRKVLRRLRARGAPPVAAPPGHALYLRMTLSERLQHGTLALSFVVLVITGFMLHYPEAWWVAGLRRLSDDLFDLRSLLHRIAAVAMVAASLFHMYYLAFTARGRSFLRDIMLCPSDLRDAWGVMRYNLGLAREKPRFGRFSYVEKSEYWALVWGTIVMTLTGVILWFEGTFVGLLTKLGWDISRTVHFYEAWLATLAILVWHIYYVVFNPDVYPMNFAWLTGTLTEEQMAEEHPRELEETKRRRLEEEARARVAAGGSGGTGSPAP